MEHLTTSAGQSLQRPVNLYGKKVVYLPCMLHVFPEENGGQFKQAHVVPAKPLALGKGSAKVGRK